MDMVSCQLCNGSCIDVACPLVVKLYKQNMGGVDLLAHVDQVLGGTCGCAGSFEFVLHKFIHSGICQPKPCPAYS